uniref:Uncharacterized protein n=1 Tax=Rhizophora mucronata TaxID=61149 RepID=A0A2P2NS24_RHIMU
MLCPAQRGLNLIQFTLQATVALL